MDIEICDGPASPFIFKGTQWLVPFRLVKYDPHWRHIESSRFILKNMEDVLNSMIEGTIPGAGCREEWFEVYIQGLIYNQRFDCEPLKPGSWAVAEHAIEMESDAFDDYVFWPTFLAVGILAFTLMSIPHVYLRIQGLEQSLSIGLNFACLRRLSGHGYDWLKTRTSALNVLERSRALDLLLARPSISKAMVSLLADVHRETVTILNDNEGDIEYGTWGPYPRSTYEKIALQTRPFALLPESCRNGDPDWYCPEPIRIKGYFIDYNAANKDPI